MKSYLLLAMLAFLCVCVGMQVLGVPMTLWDPQFDLESSAASSLQDVSIPETILIITGLLQYTAVPESSCVVQFVALSHSLFHPPVSS
jgi:hypothetical protein